MKASYAVLLLSAASFVHGQDEGIVIQPEVDSVAMFKNGMTVVRASFEAGKPGDHVWIDPPKAVHGAFFVESGPGLVIRSTTRMMKPDGPAFPTGNLQRDLAGAIVSVSLGSEGGKLGETVTGKVWAVPQPERIHWNTDYATTEGRHYGAYHGSPPGRAAAITTGSWLVLESGDDRRFIAMSRIGQVRVAEEAAEPVTEPRAVMVFSAKEAGKVQLTYLTKGMAWMPAYRVDLLAGDRLRLRQTAVVRNELMNLEKTWLELISGYPNIKFAHVDSPLGAQATLAAFFQQISQQGGGQAGVATQQVAYNVLSNRASEAVFPLPRTDQGAPAEDLHHEGIGRHDLLEGDSLSLEVASAETSCERIVEWRVPDYRDDRGRLQRNRERKDADEPWDAVQFANPFEFPMTTAAASVLQGKRFRGQSMATWTAPGHKASIRINKALTVRGEHSEVEEEGKREIIWIAGQDFQRTVVSGRLKVSNARPRAVKM
ncbi:MAG: hypothetical protein GWO24_19600, partial [Akkermansiaceae bacterium]|nr:hypothetical protein [Akkermansiaceae bacterium]